MLKQRVLTALILGAVALLSVFVLPTWGMAIVLGVALLVGAWEWAGFARQSDRARLGYAGGIALLMLITAPVSQSPRCGGWRP